MNWQQLYIIGLPYARAAFIGAVAAGAIDLAAFRTWKSFDDALKYQWGLALWRWFQGALLGALTFAGIS